MNSNELTLHGLNRVLKPITTSKVLQDVLFERGRQDKKWGVQNNTLMEWVSIEMEELGEAAMEANKATYSAGADDRAEHILRCLEEWVQVAAVAVAAAESINRQLHEMISPREEVLHVKHRPSSTARRVSIRAETPERSGDAVPNRAADATREERLRQERLQGVHDPI